MRQFPTIAGYMQHYIRESSGAHVGKQRLLQKVLHFAQVTGLRIQLHKVTLCCQIIKSLGEWQAEKNWKIAKQLFRITRDYLASHWRTAQSSPHVRIRSDESGVKSTSLIGISWAVSTWADLSMVLVSHKENPFPLAVHNTFGSDRDFTPHHSSWSPPDETVLTHWTKTQKFVWQWPKKNNPTSFTVDLVKLSTTIYVLTLMLLLARSQHLMFPSSIDMTFSASLDSQITLQFRYMSGRDKNIFVWNCWLLDYHPSTLPACFEMKQYVIQVKPSWRITNKTIQQDAFGGPRFTLNPLVWSQFHLLTLASKPFSSPTFISSWDPACEFHRFTPHAPSNIHPKSISRLIAWGRSETSNEGTPLLWIVMNWSDLIGLAARSQTSDGWANISTIWMDSDPSSYSTRRTWTGQIYVQ